MSSVQTASSTPSAASLFGGTGGSSNTQATQDRFLALLVAQMRNQDPLNPLDNAQVTSQMAQLSTVTGIEKMNSSLTALTASLGASQTAQAASLIDRVVLAPGNTLGTADGENVLGFELPYGVDQLSVKVTDAAGVPVRTIELGSRAGGVGLSSWDGLNDQGQAVAAGSYRFTLDAVQGGRPVDAIALSLSGVRGVYQEDGAVRLDVGAAGSVAYADVRRIY